MMEDRTYSEGLEDFRRQLQVMKASPFPEALLYALQEISVPLDGPGKKEWGEIVMSLFTEDVRRKLMNLVERSARSTLIQWNACALEEYRRVLSKLRDIRKSHVESPPAIAIKRGGMRARLSRLMGGGNAEQDPRQPLWDLFYTLCPYFGYGVDLERTKQIIENEAPEVAKAELVRLLDNCIQNYADRAQRCIDFPPPPPIDPHADRVKDSGSAGPGTGESGTASS